MAGSARKLLPVALLATLCGLLAYARWGEPRRLRVRHYLVGVPDLASDLEGLRLAYLTDFHLNGPDNETELTRRALEITEQEEPDLVLLGGDYFDQAKFEEGRELFDRLTSFEHVFAVLGNHDLRRGEMVDEIVAVLERRGVCVLRNSSVSVRLRDRDVTIAGVEDPYLERDDVDAALASTRADLTRPLVLLAHAPTLVDRLPIGAAQLILCGHTHGGQIRLSPLKTASPLDSTWYLDPLYGRPKSRHLRGFHWVRGNLIFVSNGIGTTRLPLRFLATPEVTMLHLTAAPPQPELACDTAARYVKLLA